MLPCMLASVLRAGFFIVLKLMVRELPRQYHLFNYKSKLFVLVVAGGGICEKTVRDAIKIMVSYP